MLFDPRPYEEELGAILDAIDATDALGAADAPGALDRILREHPRDGKGLFRRSELLAGARHLRGAEAEAALAARLRLRPVRSRSGVTPVTVLTKPFPCPGRCVFCPNDVRMPKSYLSDEPGAQRAATHRFDPYRQTWSRLAAYREIGHPTDKVELIVLGGTWSAYPAAYQRWFVTRCLEALRDFGEGRDRRAETASAITPHAPAPETAPTGASYNARVRAALRGAPPAAEERASWESLERAQRANETAGARCVGLSLETRPDRVDAREVRRLRRLGATKVQLGVQSLSDHVLRRSRRGHDAAASRRAARLLRADGFKLQMHWMPNLLGATPESDVADGERLFADPDLRPDELKIYPCSLVESADLMHDYRAGRWRPYTHEELLFVLTEVLRRVPRWCRLTRVVRDISSDDIVAGNKRTNFREIAERALAERGERVRDVRAREIRDARVDPEALRLRATAYATGVGRERFLEWVTPDDRLVAFLRLSLPGPAAASCEELRGSALVREVHVYGPALRLGARAAGEAQHRGLGARLVAEAARIARAEGYRALAVISAMGTRGWYRRLGFRDGALYQHLSV